MHVTRREVSGRSQEQLGFPRTERWETRSLQPLPPIRAPLSSGFTHLLLLVSVLPPPPPRQPLPLQGRFKRHGASLKSSPRLGPPLTQSGDRGLPLPIPPNPQSHPSLPTASSYRAPFPWRPKRPHCQEPQRTGASPSSRGLDLPTSTAAPGASAHQPPKYFIAPGAHAPGNSAGCPFTGLFTFTSEVFQPSRVQVSLQVLGLNRAPSCPHLFLPLPSKNSLLLI